MARHVPALIAVTVAGWLVLVEVLERCSSASMGWYDCSAERAAVPDLLLAVAVAGAMGAVLVTAPWRSWRPSRAVFPAFIPVGLVAGIAFASDTPREDGRELLQQMRVELRASGPFELFDLFPPAEDPDLTVLPAGATVAEAENGLPFEWGELGEALRAAKGRQIWIIHNGDDIKAWTPVPRTLGGCLHPFETGTTQGVVVRPC